MKNTREVKALGDKLRILRKDANLSQEELAWEAEVGLRTIQRLETGENAASVDVIFSVSKALGIKPSELFPDPDSKSKKLS